MAIAENMDEREQADFDMRLEAQPRGPQRPSEGVEQLWGLMGRPGVASGARPAPRRPSPTGRKVGETPS